MTSAGGVAGGVVAAATYRRMVEIKQEQERKEIELDFPALAAIAKDTSLHDKPSRDPEQLMQKPLARDLLKLIDRISNLRADVLGGALSDFEKMNAISKFFNQWFVDKRILHYAPELFNLVPEYIIFDRIYSGTPGSWTKKQDLLNHTIKLLHKADLIEKTHLGPCKALRLTSRGALWLERSKVSAPDTSLTEANT